MIQITHTATGLPYYKEGSPAAGTELPHNFTWMTGNLSYIYSFLSLTQDVSVSK